MPVQKYNARDCEFEIEDPAAPGTYVPIAPGAINTFSRTMEDESTATTSFGSQGQGESQKMEITKALQLEGTRLKDPVTGALDAGQEIVEEVAELLGEDSLNGFRFKAPGDTTWEVWQAWVSLGDQGGGNNDKVSWSATFNRSGASTTEAVI